MATLPESEIPQPLWVFGYGSLLWNPEFPVAEQRVARAQDYHRSFCMRSIHHRGTVADPGLVLALDRATGGFCDGLALRVEPGAEAATLAQLRERELISSAYVERAIGLDTSAGPVRALTYVMNRDHPQYCELELEAQAQIIATAVGGRGPNDAYLFNTVDHLSELGIADPDLDWLVSRVRALTTP